MKVGMDSQIHHFSQGYITFKQNALHKMHKHENLRAFMSQGFLRESHMVLFCFSFYIIQGFHIHHLFSDVWKFCESARIIHLLLDF